MQVYEIRTQNSISEVVKKSEMLHSFIQDSELVGESLNYEGDGGNEHNNGQIGRWSKQNDLD